MDKFTESASVEVFFMDSELETEIYGDVKPYSNEGFELFNQYMKASGISYYGADNEDFYFDDAIAVALKEGNTKVIVENLS